MQSVGFVVKLQNLRCLIIILLHKYLHIFAIQKYLEQNVFKTLTTDISILYWAASCYKISTFQLMENKLIYQNAGKFWINHVNLR